MKREWKMASFVTVALQLLLIALPLTSLADLVWDKPAWDERMMVPACNMPEWLVIVGFAVASVVLFVVMRRKGVSFMMFFVIEITLAAAIVALVAYCSRHVLFFEERVIHHPAEHHGRPHRCQHCHSSSCYGQCQDLNAATTATKFGESELDAAHDGSGK